MLGAALTLRFDGSFRGGCGGAGAVLLSDSSVLWQGARYVANMPNSACAEYEGLILGLEAASRQQPSALRVEGDCRLVLTQVSGIARPRKLGKLHKRAVDAMDRLALETNPTFDSISRADNEHADALSRAAVEATQNLHSGAILAACRDGRSSGRQHALATLERAHRERVRLSPEVLEQFMDACAAAEDWRALLSVYSAAQRDPQALTERTVGHAITALEALGAKSRGDSGWRADPSRRQLAELQRQQAALAQRRERLVALAASSEQAESSRAQEAAREAADGRGAAARTWQDVLEREAGGRSSLQGEVAGEAEKLLCLADRLASTGLALGAGDAEFV